MYRPAALVSIDHLDTVAQRPELAIDHAAWSEKEVNFTHTALMDCRMDLANSLVFFNPSIGFGWILSHVEAVHNRPIHLFYLFTRYWV